LSSFDQINPDMQERITFVLGGRYENLRTWIEDYIASSQAPLSVSEGDGERDSPLPQYWGRGRGWGPVELDHFLSRLFGEVLSQAGYGFHRNYDAGEVAANLIESVQKFRWVTGGNAVEEDEGKPLGQEYVEMVQDGVVAAQYIRSWQLQ
ncbi:MAG: hypothetical protein GTN71_16600, partial [Anaerolineae bacterium]|nr:hypothetical protein [Anaerolineae bacterium]